jgi:hypothetical protein
MAGLVAGVSYLMRPSFMLFPFFITVYTLLFQRSELRYSLVHAGVVALMLLPFSYWNYVNHGVFKPTPLEGGGGVAHIGYWRFKLPRNYVERFYWSNTTEYDCTEPFRLSDEERHKGQIAFEKEWTEILARLDTCHSAEDKIQLKYMAAATPGKFKLYNSQFTRGREHLLWEKTLMHAREDPWFYFKTRIYTLCRSYYTGISYNNWVVSTSMVSRIKTVYPFMVTFFCIFIGLCISTIYVFRVKSEGLLILWSIAAYQGVVHMFFTIQARYIVPVHFTVLILLSLTLGSWIATRRQKNLARI